MQINMDNDVLDKAKNFMRLVFANERRIYAYIYLLIPSRTEAEDIFQETLSIMWAKYEQFEQGRDFGAWGIGIAHNLIRNYRKKKRNSPLSFEEDIEDLLDREARQSIKSLDSRVEALRQCLNQMNPLDRRMIHLRYEKNASVKNLAEMMNTTMKAIYVKLARAHDWLLRCVRRTLAEQGN
ncbi:MAG TPA: sigma-70 family RNA polymerase sigma factor [Anaerohalosphaeraceae bacterium]|nr:sigma-70 family RNA polymerase sigma factor [Anaerohalosphaeraceae bacterium]HOL89137.1 sigma-70 family RNA polymerase sigma factor [Anaerohalosphaeraceae bacterium]HPP56328.1 sigma-70 family RNA polymerase sigma factor [Anaerohalosphaeraceae bacterium]